MPYEKRQYKMYTVLDNKLNPSFEEVNDFHEPYNRCRQDLPNTYLYN